MSEAEPFASRRSRAEPAGVKGRRQGPVWSGCSPVLAGSLPIIQKSRVLERSWLRRHNRADWKCTRQYCRGRNHLYQFNRPWPLQL